MAAGGVTNGKGSKQAAGKNGSYFRDHPLRTYGLVIALGVVPLGMFLFGAHRLINYQQTQQLLKNSSSTGKRVALVIEDSLNDSKRFLQTVAARPDIVEQTKAAGAAATGETLGRVRTIGPQFSALIIYDRDGKKLASDPAAAELAGEVRLEDVRRGLETEESTYVSAFLARGDGYAAVLAVPIRDRGGREVGVLVGEEGLESVTRALYTYSSEEASGLYFIVDQNGQVVGKEQGKLRMVEANRDAVGRLAKQAPKESGERIMIAGQETIVAYRAIPSAGWAALISVPTAVLEEALWKAEKMLALFGGIMLLLAVGGGGAVAALLQRFRARETRYQQEIAAREHALEVDGRLRQAQKMEAVGRLASGVAHDFNNILNVVSGYAELLTLGAQLPETERKMVTEIQAAAKRAAGLTHQLLAFGRKQVMAPVVLDPNATCREMERMLERALGEDVELVTQLDPKISRVLIDRGQLEQVLLNLAVNARDAMPRGGRLVVATRMAHLDEAYAEMNAGVVRGRYVELSVSDNGEGMTEETRKHLFEPFYTTKEVGRGTGLGLATVYGIVKQSGGHVSVYSEVGHGSVFKVYLPATDAPEQKEAAQVAEISGGTETILLVEDETQLRTVSRMFLESRGYTVFEAPTGNDALRLLEDSASNAALVITDVVMPGISGRDLARQIATRQPNMKILFMSGYTDDAMLRHGLEHGNVPFIRKPFSLQELSTKVRAVLAQPLGSA
ncbi:MAG: response regulator [Candidatus Koribacter versatilis]|uniref:histidine kinase n=1 Tax=Candidatus Korobacter versatilis TaxID=658062 RepID=A0A932A962_9BACT|nr:response regulator [Candidatus Koribacter versatilis]